MNQFSSPSAPTGENPDVTCQALGFCNGTCQLYPGNSWPVPSPDYPTDGGVIDTRRRRLLSSEGSAAAGRAHGAKARSPANGASGRALRSRGAGAGVAHAGHAAGLTHERVKGFLHALDAENKRREEPMGYLDMWTYTMRFMAMGPCEDALNITCDIDRVFDKHLPLADNDNDYFASPNAELLSNGLRGGDWRGRDCNDNDATIYAGRRVPTVGDDQDWNCNGIFGSNATGSYESMFCSGANAPMGVAILGDSAAAHFHIPPEYVNAKNFNLSGILELASNEADWPQCSWSTGFRTTAECPASVNAPMSSIYQRMLELNRCNFRDFQNIGVNGARVGSMSPPGIINSLARNQQTDQPMLVFHALIGNDVCNGHPGSGSWTTVTQFRNAVVASLQYLDTVLPNGSHVAFLGLADGRVLYDTTHNRTHPLGITYPVLYDYLSCNNANPCWGWLNTNETWRNATSQRAAQLTAVYDNITATMTFRNFDMYRVQVDWWTLIEEYSKTADPMNIIEPVDGFHPSQTGQQLLAMTIWDDLQTNRPNWLPAENPHNWEIMQIFGDQGGWG